MMLSITDPYQAYVEGSYASDNALGMVVALYEGAIEAVRRAKQCLEAGDIWGRSKAINKAFAIVSELLASLDHERGGEISSNLKRLYSYMQCKLVDSHVQQAGEPLDEVEGLLGTMLDGWKSAARKADADRVQAGGDCPTENRNPASMTEELSGAYGFFSEEMMEPAGCVSEVF